MKMVTKLALGAAAVVVATAASFPGPLSEFYHGTFPNDLRSRQALDFCAARELPATAVIVDVDPTSLS